MVGGFENLEIKRAPSQIRPPNFSRGRGWILIKEMHFPGFEKYHISKNARGGLLSLILHI